MTDMSDSLKKVLNILPEDTAEYRAHMVEKLSTMKVSGWPLTRDQKNAMLKLAMWLKKVKEDQKANKHMLGLVPPPVFRLFGLAGCGKTTCSVAIKMLGLRPLYVSFTNRAVGVLASKGCTPCKTVHSVIYDVYDGESTMSPRDMQMQQEYLSAVEAGVPPAERPPLPSMRSSIGWERREWSDIQEVVKGYDCIVVDEASMIGNTTGQDLEFIGLPIIGIGDPGQLKPVGDYPYFDPRSPDVLLTQVLRTDGDILELAAHVRRGGSFTDMSMGEDFEVRRKADPSWFDVDQVICGIHDKRRELNKHVRKLRGFTGFIPSVGEKICVVANNKEVGVTNGSLWEILSVDTEGDYGVFDLIEFAPRKKKEERELRFAVYVHMTCFIQDIKNRDDMCITVRSDSCLATWGWAITCHKSQGSEWDTILVFDDGHVFREETRNWRYTAVTRAAKKAYIVSRH